MPTEQRVRNQAPAPARQPGDPPDPVILTTELAVSPGWYVLVTFSAVDIASGGSVPREQAKRWAPLQRTFQAAAERAYALTPRTAALHTLTAQCPVHQGFEAVYGTRADLPTDWTNPRWEPMRSGLQCLRDGWT